ncbi:MAG: NHLP family bacteriocin export ABC transporter peptidase/permease/ATPase subunit [Alphaproteobacteria bacterium]
MATDTLFSPAAVSSTPTGFKPVRVRTPTILQMEAVECGAASLAMVLAHFGRWVPLEELRVACGVSRDGSSALNIVKAARGYGLEAKGFRHEPEKLPSLSLPQVIYWKFNHFMVVEGYDRGGVQVNDPALGRRTIDWDEFDRGFTGIVLTFAPTPEFKTGGERPQVFPQIKRWLTGAGDTVAFVMVISLLMAIPGIIIPGLTKVFVDDYLIDGHTDWLRPLIVAFCVSVFTLWFLSAMQQRILVRFEMRLGVASAGKLVWHMLNLPAEFFAQRYVGDLVERVEANRRLARLISGEIGTNLVNLVSVVFFGAMMLSYDLVVGLTGVSFGLINLAVLVFVWRRQEEGNRRLAQDSGKVYAVAMDGISSIESAKASGLEGALFERFAGYQTRFLTLSQELARVSAIVSTVPSLLAALGTMAVLGIGAMRVISGHMTMGELVAFQALLMAFNLPITRLVELGGKLQAAMGDLARLDDVMHYRTVTPPSEAQCAIRASKTPKLTGLVEMRGVTFGYNKLAEPLIRDFNLPVQPGARVAIVGLSGCGKSTLVRLLSGLYVPWSGEILFDGQPINRIDPAVFGNSVSVVDQDINLFETTIRDNITLWDAAIPQKCVVDAARDAAVHDIITARPGAYNAMIREQGANFSGGERQRMEIARALATNPTILVMDEATAALDPATEKQVDDNIRRRGATCIIVAHRLSTIRDSDEIIVLEQGVAVERGKHDDLIRNKEGAYARLIAAQ